MPAWNKGGATDVATLVHLLPKDMGPMSLVIHSSVFDRMHVRSLVLVSDFMCRGSVLMKSAPVLYSTDQFIHS